MAKVVKVESNITGVRYAEEVSLGVLDADPANQRWIELEPNSYTDFGGDVQTVARNPINPGRQRKKGVVTNVEASGGFQTDLTQVNLQDILQGFFYADLRRKTEFSGSITVTAMDNRYAAPGIHTGVEVGDLVLMSGFQLAANNGLKRVVGTGVDSIDVAEDTNDEGPLPARFAVVGHQLGLGTAAIVNPGGGDLPYLESATKDFTEMGLIPGEWIFIGGDDAVTQFTAVPDNNGFARVRSVTQDRITFDKTSAEMFDDAGTGKTIRLFVGRVLKNEVGSDIIRRSYTLERTLGFSDDADPTKEQAEYLIGAVPNEFTINFASANKVEVDVEFVALRSTAIDENADGAPDLLSKVAGTVRVPIQEAAAFNTSSDFSRIRLSRVIPGDAFPDPLFTYSEEMTVSINNNNSPNLALGVLGAFEVTAGLFEVGAEITAYLGDIEAVRAVQRNENITLDAILVKENSGVAMDMPLVTLADGRPDVEQDQPVMIPLTSEAASGAIIHPGLNHTLLLVFFDFLPELAEAAV